MTLAFSYSMAFFAQTMLVLFHFISIFVFILDLSDRNVVSMGYTCIVWPLIYGVLTITATVATVVYIQGHRRTNGQLDAAKRAELFFPSYQQPLFSAFTNSLFLFAVGLTCVIIVGVQVGLGFEPHNELKNDPATRRYTFSHIILVTISVLSLFDQLNALLTLIGHMYKLNDLSVVVRWVDSTKNSVLVFDNDMAARWKCFQT